MPTLPDGWQYNTMSGGAALSSIVIPAGGLNVSHFLQNIKARIYNTAAGAGSYNPVIVVLNGAAVLFTWPLILDLSVIGSDDLDIPVIREGSPGTSMTVAFNTASPATVGQALIITGYDS